VLREVVEPDFLRAKAMLESVPTTVARDLSAASAHRVKVRLEEAGAAVAVRRGAPPER
jgi:ribosomal protein L7/L12